MRTRTLSLLTAASAAAFLTLSAAPATALGPTTTVASQVTTTGSGYFPDGWDGRAGQQGSTSRWKHSAGKDWSGKHSAGKGWADKDWSTKSKGASESEHRCDGAAPKADHPGKAEHHRKPGQKADRSWKFGHHRTKDRSATSETANGCAEQHKHDERGPVRDKDVEHKKTTKHTKFTKHKKTADRAARTERSTRTTGIDWFDWCRDQEGGASSVSVTARRSVPTQPETPEQTAVSPAPESSATPSAEDEQPEPAAEATYEVEVLSQTVVPAGEAAPAAAVVAEPTFAG